MVEAGSIQPAPVILQSLQLQLHIAIPTFLVFLLFLPLEEISPQTGTSGQSRSARSGMLDVELTEAN